MKRLHYSDMIKGGIGFESERFMSPDACFYPVYAWVWNDILSEERIKKQIDEMYEVGIICFYIIPEPKNFRPYTMVTNLEPDYLTDEFMEYVRFTADYANSKGMYMWLYDEGGWPSGGAAGKVSLAEPKTVSKRLERRSVPLKKGEIYSVPKGVKAVFYGDKRIFSGASFETDVELMEYFIKTSDIDPVRGARTDLSEKLTSETFIDLTHERYKEYIGDYFGKTVPFMFTDEACLMTPSFCYDFEERFKEKYGYDITDYFPILFKSQGDNDAENRVRIDYFSLCGEIFDENYLKMQAAWCEKNGLLFTGHLDKDHCCEQSVKEGYSSYVNSLSNLHVPGVDVIWRQIDFGKEPSEGIRFFPRLAASAAAKNGGNLAVSESFCAYGSGLTYNEMRYVENYQYIRGINVMNVMNISYGRDRFLAFAERPSFGKEKPGYENLEAFNDFTARMSYITTVGSSGAETLLYLPQKDFFAGGDICSSAVKAFDSMGKMLEDKGIDFHVCDDYFIREAEASCDGLKIGNRNYKYVYIPENRYMPEDVKEKLLPFISDAVPVCVILEGFCSVHASKRILGNGDEVIILVNEGATCVTAKLSFVSNKKFAYELDAVSGNIYAVGNGLNTEATFAIGENRCYLLTDDIVETVENFKKKQVFSEIPLNTFEVSSVAEFILDEKGGFKKKCTENFVHFPLGSWKKLFGEAFSGDVVYRTVFDVDNINFEKAVLSLGKVEHSASVKVNGKESGSVIFEPMELELERSLFKIGENVLELTVSNTAANQFVLSGADALFEPKEIGPYNDRSKEFEKEHIDGGLYGPVNIRFVK